MPFLLLGPLPTPERRRQQVQSLSHQRLLAKITPGGSWAVSCSLQRSGTSNKVVTRHPPAILGNEGQQGPSPLT